MKPIREIVSREIIDDLWGAGYTILPRRRGPDPFDFDPKMVPATRSYQWMHLVTDKVMIGTGWTPVPASRHDGYFMPAGHVGDIEVSGLGLFEKPRFEVDQERAASRMAAQKQVTDWAKQTGAEFSGSFNIGGEETKIGVDPDAFRTSNKTIETTVKIPKDMIPHMAAIFEERDRLAAEQVAAWRNSDAEPTDLQRKITREYNVALGPGFEQGLEKGDWPILHATVLPYAIENVRAKLKEKSS